MEFEFKSRKLLLVPVLAVLLYPGSSLRATLHANQSSFGCCGSGSGSRSQSGERLGAYPQRHLAMVGCG